MRAMVTESTVVGRNVLRRGGNLVPVLAVLALVTTLPTLWARFVDAPSSAQPIAQFSSSRPLSVALMWLAGCALISIWRGNRRVAQVLAALTMAVSVGGAVVGSIGAPSVFAIALAVGVMFFACGFALWLLSRPPLGHRALVIVGSIGAMMLAMCAVLAVAAVGDLLQTELARRFAQVSPTALIGVSALSIALMRYVAAHEAAGVAPPRWLPVAVGVAGASMMLVFWQTLLARETAETIERARIASDAVQRAIQRQFVVIDRSVARVALYAETAPPDAPLWRTSIERLTAETNGLERILWLDSTGTMLRVTTDAAVPPAVAQSLRQWARELARQASDTTSAQSSAVVDDIPIEARAIAPFGVVLLHTVRSKTTGIAVIVGFVSEPALMRDFLSDHSSGFAIRAFVNDSLMAGPVRSTIPPVFESQMQFGDRRVKLTFTPDPAPAHSTFPELLLLLGLAVAALVSVTLWLARKSWEQASVEGMARMQRAIERSTDGVWELDLLEGSAHRSGALVRSLGHDPATVNGKSSAWSGLIHKDDLDRVSDALNAHVRGETDVFESEYRVRAGDGSWHTIVDRGRVIERTNDGRPARLLGITADTTERARAAAAQERSDRRFRAMFDSAYQLQLLLGLDGVILEVNRAAADFAGQSVDAMQGTQFSALSWWNADDLTSTRVQERFERARNGDATRFEVQTKAAEGRSATIDFSLRPIRDANDAVIQVLVEGHDLTERKRAEESLRQIGALTTMGQLAARVAHEINNPLAGIQNAFLLVRSGISTDHPHFRFVGAIEREIARIAAVTRQLYETYRPDQSMDSQSSVILAMSDAVSFLEQVNRARNIRIVTNVARAPSLVPVPDALLRQTLYNLVQNALDASPPNGTIEVSAVLEGEWCVIRVCDEGPGIPERIRERIFEPFFSTKDRTMKTGGMGIGLALVRQSVLAVGGQVTVSDRPGGGTQFEVRLPMQPIDTGVLR